MHHRFICVVFLLLWAVSPLEAQQAEVPAGKVEGPYEWRSEIFPGTIRNYWVYVPAQYDGSRPARVMVVQDGMWLPEEWNLPETLDELIASGEVPVTIGIFVESGKYGVAQRNLIILDAVVFIESEIDRNDRQHLPRLKRFKPQSTHEIILLDLFASRTPFQSQLTQRVVPTVNRAAHCIPSLYLNDDSSWESLIVVVRLTRNDTASNCACAEKAA